MNGPLTPFDRSAKVTTGPSGNRFNAIAFILQVPVGCPLADHSPFGGTMTEVLLPLLNNDCGRAGQLSVDWGEVPQPHHLVVAAGG